MIRKPLADWEATACELLVIGGGATGLGVAVQAALEGRRVVLVEANDFASGTSSRSTKLLHGGVRYLAQGRLGLVREALHERARVLALAPHLAQPLPFVVATPHWRTWAAMALGLKLYQWLAGRLSLGPTEVLSRQAMAHSLPPGLPTGRGVRYWDGQFDDARLALALAQSAEQAGARVRNHTTVTALRPQDKAIGPGWVVTLRDSFTGASRELSARCVVNAAGVWVDGLRQLAHTGAGQAPAKALVQASQGVHLVVDRATLPLREAVLLPRTRDGRVLFAVPWLGATVIGTTDTPRADAPFEPAPLASELAFLREETERLLGLRLQPGQVRSVWVGLRPLVGSSENTSALSREHAVVREGAGFWTVTGGKWTTYRSMAEDVLAQVQRQGDLSAAIRAANTREHRLFGAPAAPTAGGSLRDAPGPHLLGAQAQVLASLPGHGVGLGLGLTEAMVRHSARVEWAVTVEDMLARRWRVLFLDSRLAEQMAPRVAQLLHEETGLDPQLDAFVALCRRYRWPDSGPEPASGQAG